MGGPPIRGDLRPYWEPERDLTADEFASWLQNAERIATGITVLAHLDAFIDAENLRVGFSCEGNEELAAAYLTSILNENIEARRVAPVTSGRNLPADEIVLPCKPFADDEYVQQSVLAAMKASHALEFETILEQDLDPSQVLGYGERDS